MKPFFDHNISPRVVNRLHDMFPDASHVVFVGLERASDVTVWRYAQQHQYTIVTKDADYNDLSVLYGFPPKIIWLQLGNCTTRDVETALRRNYIAISEFTKNPAIGVLIII